MTGYKTDRHRTENGANSVAGRSRTSSFPIGQDSLQNEISRSGYKQYGSAVPRITGPVRTMGFYLLRLFDSYFSTMLDPYCGSSAPVGC